MMTAMMYVVAVALLALAGTARGFYPGQPVVAPAPTEKSGLSIGITCILSENSAFTSASLQAPLHLLDSLSYGDRHTVALIDLGTTKREHVPADWGLSEKETIVAWADVATLSFDIVIEVGRISPAQLHELQQRGTKVYSFRSGNEFDVSSEIMLYNKTASSLLYTTRGYDGFLYTDASERSKAFYEIILDCPGFKVPVTWSPRFYEHVMLNVDGNKFYVPDPEEPKKRISIFENNDLLNRNAVMPMVIVELLYRESPELIKQVYVTNTGDIGSHTHFRKFANSKMSVYKDKHMSFEARYRVPYFLSKYTDIVLSFQWDAPISSTYFEALYGGYPLVHNSPFFKDCGYYYESFDGEDGVDQLRLAILQHDNDRMRYNAKARACLHRVFATSGVVIAEWDRTLQQLMSTQPRANQP